MKGMGGQWELRNFGNQGCGTGIMNRAELWEYFQSPQGNVECHRSNKERNAENALVAFAARRTTTMLTLKEKKKKLFVRLFGDFIFIFYPFFPKNGSYLVTKLD